MNKTVVYFLAFYFVCQFQGFCGDKLKLGTFSIPRMVENENQGTFISLTRDMAERVNLNIEIIIFPPKRAWVSFFKNKIDVIFPAFDVNFPEGTQKVTSIAVSSKPDYVFTRKGTPLFRTIEDLNGKRVGLTLGYPYEKKMLDNPLITFDLASTDVCNAKKLIQGRVDAFISSITTGLESFKQLGLLHGVQFDILTPLSIHPFYYGCQDTQDGKEICRKISTALYQMKKDGTLQRLERRMKD